MNKSGDKNWRPRRQKLAPGPLDTRAQKQRNKKKVLTKKKPPVPAENDLWTLYCKARVRGKALSFASCCGSISVRGDKADLSHPKGSTVPLWTLIGKDQCPDSETLDRRLDQGLEEVKFTFPSVLLGQSHLEAKYDRLYFKRTIEKEQMTQRIAELEETVRQLTMRLNAALGEEQPTTQGTVIPLQNDSQEPEEPIRRSFLSE